MAMQKVHQMKTVADGHLVWKLMPGGFAQIWLYAMHRSDYMLCTDLTVWYAQNCGTDPALVCTDLLSVCTELNPCTNNAPTHLLSVPLFYPTLSFQKQSQSSGDFDRSECFFSSWYIGERSRGEGEIIRENQFDGFAGICLFLNLQLCWYGVHTMDHRLVWSPYYGPSISMESILWTID